MIQKIIWLLISVLFLSTGCKNDHYKDQNFTSNYTCPMHPSVNSSSPGACPVCGMSLIATVKTEVLHPDKEGNFVVLDERQQILAGIEIDTAKFRTIEPTSTILGKVTLDEEAQFLISSRVKGRIEKLYTKVTGEYIRKGDPVYSIYSEGLIADEKEFIELLHLLTSKSQSNGYVEEMLKASRNKLSLWGLTKKQILDLEKSNQIHDLVTFYSAASGYVTEVNIKEKEYVEEGTPLIKLSGLNKVWIEAQVYPNEKIAGNHEFQVYTENAREEIYEGHLIFYTPLIETGQKIQLLRLSVNNAKNKLIPGMMVYVSPKRKSKPVLSVPKSAVLQEKMKSIWVKSDETTFEQRMVETGLENKYSIEIISGLKEGDLVVSAGAYLINSEFILKSGAGQRHDHVTP